MPVKVYNLADDADAEIEQWLNDLVEQIYRQKGMPDGIDGSISRYYAERIWKEIVKGYEMDIPASPVDWDTPDAEMLRHLKENVYQFSSAKNWQQMRALTTALIDDQNKLRTRADFFKEAYKINDQHVHTWLDAERELAISSAQMASKWVEIQNDKEFLPLLLYDAVIDEATSDICRLFNGILLPVDDPFWDENYPPNHFGPCRSTVRQEAEGTTTLQRDIVYPEKMQKMFKVNLAKRGLAFPPDHPYWKGIPEKVKTDALALMPYENQFQVVAKEKAAFVTQHINVDTDAPDYPLHLAIATEKMHDGSKVDIMPIIHQKDAALRDIIYPDVSNFSNPDLRIDGILAEVKNPTKMRWATVKHSIDEASSQAGHVIINLTDNIDESVMRKLCAIKFSDHARLTLIEFRIDGTYYSFHRKDFVK